MKITSESRQTSFQYTQQLYVVKRSYHKPSFSDCHCCSLSLFFWIVVKILFHQQISIFFLLHSIAIDVATVEIFKHFLSLNTVWIFPQGHVWEEGTFVEQYCCTAILLWLSFQFHLSLSLKLMRNKMKIEGKNSSVIKKKSFVVYFSSFHVLYECKLLFAMHFPFKHLQTKNFSVSNRSRESAFEELRKYCINWPDSKELFCFYEIENRFLMFLFVCDSQFSWKQALKLSSERWKRPFGYISRNRD